MWVNKNNNVLDKRLCKIMICSFSDISHLLKDFHYKKDSIGGGISICFAMFYKDVLSGGAVLGSPRHENKYKNHIDIRRMVCTNDSPFNSESWFLGKILNWAKHNTNYYGVLSYSDLTVGHQGTIYKASNFEYIGETSPTKYIDWLGKIYHPRSLSIDRDYSYKLRDALKNGDAVIKTGLPKKIWVYKINRIKKYPKITIHNWDGTGNKQFTQLTIF